MDRLTGTKERGYVVIPQKYAEALDRLGEYEDTGLTPNEITQLKTNYDRINNFEKTQCGVLLAENGRLRAEIITKEYTMLGVMHSVDKWLDGDELKQDETNRAATVRAKTLKIVEDLQAEVERLHKIVGCGCGICLAHNDMKCPKLPEPPKGEEK